MVPSSPQTRTEVQQAVLGLLQPLRSRYVSDGLLLGHSGSSYSPRVARLEAWSRPLWGIAPLLAGGGSFPFLDRHLEILARCTDPASPCYWGTPTDKDQRLVEMAPLAFALLLARAWFWDPLSSREKENLYRWLSTIQHRELPANNWHFFRILVCTAFRSLDLPVDEAAEAESFRSVEGCYKGNGWYIDGTNATYDLYNPTGFHFYGLLYARFLQEWVGRCSQQTLISGAIQEHIFQSVERARLFSERAEQFAPQYLAWFREDGSFVPFGRSLTYRFVAASFFSACAFAGVPVFSWGILKGAVLQHLRYWFARPILDSQGLLTIGYGYPNLVMGEQYNAPGSPYWGLKTFLILALPPEHPFWASPEEPMPALSPVSDQLTNIKPPWTLVHPSTLPAEIFSQEPPGFIVSRSREDVQVLNPGYYPGWEALHSAAKYGKFVYSARFGFCVSHGAYGLEKTGCDSSLVLSEGDGYWRERRYTENVRFGKIWTASSWKPWPNVTIDSILISLGAWHVRVHRIKSDRFLLGVEGGFSVSHYGTEYSEDYSPSISHSQNPVGISVAFPWAASRIVELSPNCSHNRSAELVYPEPNLNVLESSIVIPILKGTLEPGPTLWVCAVRAGDPAPTCSEPPPRVSINPDGSISVEIPLGGSDLVFQLLDP